MYDWLSSGIIFPELHATIGALAVALAYIFAPGKLGDPNRSHRMAPRISIAVFSVVILLKETLWDPANEVAQPFLWAGAVDLAYYVVGMMVMLVALWVKFRRL